MWIWRRLERTKDVNLYHKLLGIGMSGADLNFLVREATLFCYKEEKFFENPTVKSKHFESAFGTVKPSVKNIEVYEKMRKKFEDSINKS
jgi:SpoVK/Ycf46/Vps4 family AAA+-type ATPase